MSDTFELFDLRITVEEIRGTCTCNQVVGAWFEVHGGQLILPLVGSELAFSWHAGDAVAVPELA